MKYIKLFESFNEIEKKIDSFNRSIIEFLVKRYLSDVKIERKENENLIVYYYKPVFAEYPEFYNRVYSELEIKQTPVSLIRSLSQINHPEGFDFLICLWVAGKNNIPYVRGLEKKKMTGFSYFVIKLLESIIWKTLKCRNSSRRNVYGKSSAEDIIKESIISFLGIQSEVSSNFITTIEDFKYLKGYKRLK